jgi:hypothetical protein
MIDHFGWFQMPPMYICRCSTPCYQYIVVHSIVIIIIIIIIIIIAFVIRFLGRKGRCYYYFILQNNIIVLPNDIVVSSTMIFSFGIVPIYYHMVDGFEIQLYLRYCLG